MAHDPKQILINLCAGLHLCEIRGDTFEDSVEALCQIDITVPEDVIDLRQLGHWLAREHQAQTVHGSAILEEESQVDG